jgi:putative glutathione S-transferase
LYISLACPWATACFTILKFKGLEDVISVSVVKAETGGTGWGFGKEERADILG